MLNNDYGVLDEEVHEAITQLTLTKLEMHGLVLLVKAAIYGNKETIIMYHQSVHVSYFLSIDVSVASLHQNRIKDNPCLCSSIPRT